MSLSMCSEASHANHRYEHSAFHMDVSLMRCLRATAKQNKKIVSGKVEKQIKRLQEFSIPNSARAPRLQLSALGKAAA